MKIEKFKKRPNGLYTIYLDNFNTYDLYEEIILKYELLITKTIEEAKLNKIIEDNKKYESYYEALKIIKRTIKTKEEIKQLLAEKKYSKENIDFAITTLEKQGYINDKSYAKSYVHNAIIMTNKGPKKIEEELVKKGISNDNYSAALAEYTNDLENKVDEYSKVM